MINSLRLQQYIEYLKIYLINNIVRLLKYIVTHPIKTIFFIIRLYVLFVLLIIFLVFSFASNANEPDMSDLVPPKANGGWTATCTFDGNQIEIESVQNSHVSECLPLAIPYFDAKASAIPNICHTTDFDPAYDGDKKLRLSKRLFRVGITSNCDTFSHSTSMNVTISNSVQNTNSTCPPDISPDHIITVDTGGGNIMCAKPLIDTCPEKSDDMIGLTFNTTTTATHICFTNPTNPSQKCKYEGVDGIFAHPSNLKDQVPCEDDDQTIENEEPPVDPEDGCFTTANGKYCEENPNDKCNTLTVGKNEDGSPITAMKCGNNCGEAFGTFLCAVDSTDDQMPELTDSCADTHFRLANPTVCKKDNDSVDKNGDGQTDNTDLMTGLNNIAGTNESLVEGLGSLLDVNKAMFDKISEDKANGVDSNKILSGIAASAAATDSNVATLVDILKPEHGAGALDLIIPTELQENKHDWQERNFFTVTRTFLEGVKSTTLYSSVNNFFKVSFSGSCPVYTTTVEAFGTITLDQWCGETMTSVWPWIQSILLLVFSFLAFREINGR